MTALCRTQNAERRTQKVGLHSDWVLGCSVPLSLTKYIRYLLLYCLCVCCVLCRPKVH